MFGYIVVNKAEMKYKDFDRYHAYYCGLCQSLKDRYGAFGQISLSYDMTFLHVLLTSLYEPEERREEVRCLAHPLEKHTVLRSEVTDYVADMNILLTMFKCEDDWADEKKVTRYVYGKLLRKRSCGRKKLFCEKGKNIQNLLRRISEKEKENCQDVDEMSGLFGQVMAQIVAWRKDEWEESLDRVGFYLGKFVYLMDAYEDLEEDRKKGLYNPLMRRSEDPSFEEDIHRILMMTMEGCCKEFEQLPILENLDILRNILYSGVWSRYEIAHAKRTKQDEKENVNVQ